jgi:hypothetical protein
MKTFQSIAGWEWILEAALRRGRFDLEDSAGRLERASSDRWETLALGA